MSPSIVRDFVNNHKDYHTQHFEMQIWNFTLLTFDHQQIKSDFKPEFSSSEHLERGKRFAKFEF